MFEIKQLRRTLGPKGEGMWRIWQFIFFVYHCTVLMNKSRSLIAWTVIQLYKDFSVKGSLWDIILQWIFIFLTCLKFKNFWSYDNIVCCHSFSLFLFLKSISHYMNPYHSLRFLALRFRTVGSIFCSPGQNPLYIYIYNAQFFQFMVSQFHDCPTYKTWKYGPFTGLECQVRLCV